MATQRRDRRASREAGGGLLRPSDDVSRARPLERTDRRPRQPGPRRLVRPQPSERLQRSGGHLGAQISPSRVRRFPAQERGRQPRVRHRHRPDPFDLFLAAQPARRPIILAGHSQGSLHLLRLLVDGKDALKGRLVAAYAPGWPIGIQADLPATGLPACASPGQTGCVVSWQSFAEPASTSLVTGSWVDTLGLTGTKRTMKDMLCVDPIGGTLGGRSPPRANPGTLVPSADLSSARLVPGQIGAHCDQGFLKIDGVIPAMGPYVLPGNNYHVYDYALFWGAVRRDAERRLAAWR
jgi:hypothetical protein